MELLIFIPVIAGVVAVVIGIAMEVRDERELKRKMAELEAALQEKNALLQQKTTA